MKRDSDWNQFGQYIVTLIGFGADTLLNGRFVIMQPRVSFEEKDSVHNKMNQHDQICHAEAALQTIILHFILFNKPYSQYIIEW